MEFENHKNYNCQITLDTGEQFKVYANWLHNQNLDHWQGWQCDAGVTRLHIDKSGNVYDGECQNQQIGNLNSGWSLKSESICNRKRCTGCTDDLIIKKQK